MLTAALSSEQVARVLPALCGAHRSDCRLISSGSRTVSETPSRRRILSSDTPPRASRHEPIRRRRHASQRPSETPRTTPHLGRTRALPGATPAHARYTTRLRDGRQDVLVPGTKTRRPHLHACRLPARPSAPQRGARGAGGLAGLSTPRGCDRVVSRKGVASSGTAEAAVPLVGVEQDRDRLRGVDSLGRPDRACLAVAAP